MTMTVFHSRRSSNSGSGSGNGGGGGGGGRSGNDCCNILLSNNLSVFAENNSQKASQYTSAIPHPTRTNLEHQFDGNVCVTFHPPSVPFKYAMRTAPPQNFSGSLNFTIQRTPFYTATARHQTEYESVCFTFAKPWTASAPFVYQHCLFTLFTQVACAPTPSHFSPRCPLLQCTRSAHKVPKPFENQRQRGQENTAYRLRANTLE